MSHAGVLLLGVILTAVFLWCYFTAQRLNRLHIRMDRARDSLEGALNRRAAVIGALYPSLTAQATALEDIPLTYENFSDRRAAENEFQRRLPASVSGDGFLVTDSNEASMVKEETTTGEEPPTKETTPPKETTPSGEGTSIGEETAENDVAAVRKVRTDTVLNAESAVTAEADEGARALVALSDANVRVHLATRFYNQAVTDTRHVRHRPLVKLLHLAGNAPNPAYF